MRVAASIVLLLWTCLAAAAQAPAKRLVILKVDGLNADLLFRMMQQVDPATGKSRLPWIKHIFAENGTWFANFYTRGISLSAPSWSMLDTGHHLIVRGNVEYDRYTGYVYDYLNFFPFYLGYARARSVDMPAVKILDRAGIPLLIDGFPYPEVFQSFQLFQRGVRWTTLQQALKRRFSTKALVSMVEESGGPSLDEVLADQTEHEVRVELQHPEVLYLDDFTGDIDHEGHATNQVAALEDRLTRLDGLAARIWTSIQASPEAASSIFVMVSDHGMNNVPGVFSQGFSLPDLLNSAAGGAHHVITNRHQLSDYKLSGLNPLVSKVTNASSASFYLKNQADSYPTAWLDVDGNERASVHFRNSDLNTIHILLLQLARTDLPPDIRRAAAAYLQETIKRHREQWAATADQLDEEMHALETAIAKRKAELKDQPRKWSEDERNLGEDKSGRRLAIELSDWEHEHSDYTSYVAHLRALLALHPDASQPSRLRIGDFVPQMALGDNNTVANLEHYVAGPAPNGLVLDAKGNLDPERSFRFVNYFALLAGQHTRNQPQSALSNQPIDFSAMRVAGNSYWLYRDEESQLLIEVDSAGRLRLQPVRHLAQDSEGKLVWDAGTWRAGLPLHLFEDPALKLPNGADRDDWLRHWRSEEEWFNAIHRCQYSNGVIGIIEQLSAVGPFVPGPPGSDPLLIRYERRRRELVHADFEVFAADHWNFNVRNFNPGGNHGSFFRISTHSVWMMAGGNIPAGLVIEKPADSLNFASTLQNLTGRAPAMPEKVIILR